MKLLSRALRHLIGAVEPRRTLRPRALASPESVENRCLFAVSPIHVGAIYVEQDAGSDAQGDLFEITFRGGASGTQLRRVVIDTDQGVRGFGIADNFYDIAESGFGADHAMDFELRGHAGIDRVRATVRDGGTELVLEFEGFDAGESLQFTIDVDEVETFDPNETSLPLINDGFDPITSGVEFQGTRFTADFIAPHFFDVTATSTFRNRYDEQLVASGLPLPEDDFNGRRDRSAGAFGTATQLPIPVTISGYVYHDRDNDGVRDTGEEGIRGVTVRLEPIETVTDQAPLTIVTDVNGFYRFTNLVAGRYRVIETVQPAGYFDGKDTAGTVQGQSRGTAGNEKIEAIRLDGGDDGIEFNFGELLPVSLRGRVQLTTREGDCFGDDEQHPPVAGARILLYNATGQLVAETTTNQNGEYEFTGLPPGTYRLVEITPESLIDGGSQAGQVQGLTRGTVLPDGSITDIVLNSGQNGTRYDFCEHVPATLSGYVYHDRDNDGRRESGEEGIAGTIVRLFNANNQVVASATTDSLGFYEFTRLTAGQYFVVESQPAGWIDGLDAAGTIQGVVTGRAVNPGDRIEAVDLLWGDQGIEYDFGEFLGASLAGEVHLATRDGDCFGQDGTNTPVAGAVVRLYDEQGNLLRETRTDSDGRYRFDGLIPGRYRVVELTPEGLIDGGAHAGTVNGQAVGTVVDPGTIRDIVLTSGQAGVHYDFCEFPPAMISGFVYHDRNDNGVRESNEDPIQGVLVELLDDLGRIVAATTTNAAGFYKFGGVHAGTYMLRETQPTGWLDGQDAAGIINGSITGRPQNPGDKINEILIGWGDMGTEFNFGEILPASIAGLVHTDVGIADCVFRPEQGEIVLAGVRIELLDARGNVIARTVTDAAGKYKFTDLRPGIYQVREIQPQGYFEGMAASGSNGGDHSLPNDIRAIPVGSGQQLTDYNFCEPPPVKLSGHVFQDGADIELQSEEVLPARIRDIRDGRLTADDRRLAGVWLELRNGVNGQPLTNEFALPGKYGPGPIRVQTDARGYYEFTGLRAGTYAVYEVQPSDYIDGVDTPGIDTAFVFNPGEPRNDAVFAQLQVDPQNDAIVRITLTPGSEAANNNFSEVRIRRLPPNQQLPPLNLPPQPPLLRIRPPVEPIQLRPYTLLNSPIREYPTIIGDPGPTWHLSVINAGEPRGDGLSPSAVDKILLTSLKRTDPSERALTKELTSRLQNANWSFATSYGAQGSVEGTVSFGFAGAIPISGDFNGDGHSEVGVFYKGHWLVDLNGNGRWDEGDLWARLGKESDLPVTGDWDADGKDDIGIFGPQWPGDPRAIFHERGEPDRQNLRKGKMKNVPPSPEEATDGYRYLRKDGTTGVRADVIDHVFRFGRRGDVPVAGDWNGDGISTIGVFRAGRCFLDVDGNGRWTKADRVVELGQEGEQPLVGDFNGDGIDEVAFFRDGKVYLDRNRNGVIDARDEVIAVGQPGDRPVVGDWNGDGVDEIAVYRAA